MSEFADTRKAMAEKLGKAVEVRTDYSCRAHGCPNAGSMEGDVCYFHWREADPRKWAEVTFRIRQDFDSMRNWGQISPELQAEHRAQAQKLFPGIRADRPKGMVTV